MGGHWTCAVVIRAQSALGVVKHTRDCVDKHLGGFNKNVCRIKKPKVKAFKSYFVGCDDESAMAVRWRGFTYGVFPYGNNFHVQYIFFYQGTVSRKLCSKQKYESRNRRNFNALCDNLMTQKLF